MQTISAPQTTLTTRPAPDPRRHLRIAATFMQVVAWVLAGVGILGGISLAATSDSDGWNETHPYVGLGLGLIAWAIVLACFFLVVATWAKAWLHTTTR